MNGAESGAVGTGSRSTMADSSASAIGPYGVINDPSVAHRGQRIAEMVSSSSGSLAPSKRWSQIRSTSSGADVAPHDVHRRPVPSTSKEPVTP